MTKQNIKIDKIKPSELFKSKNSSMYKTFEEICTREMLNNALEYNSSQLNLIIHALESLDTSFYDNDYKAMHANLYKRFRELKENAK